MDNTTPLSPSRSIIQAVIETPQLCLKTIQIVKNDVNNKVTVTCYRILSLIYLALTLFHLYLTKTPDCHQKVLLKGSYIFKGDILTSLIIWSILLWEFLWQSSNVKFLLNDLILAKLSWYFVRCSSLMQISRYGKRCYALNFVKQNESSCALLVWFLIMVMWYFHI